MEPEQPTKTAGYRKLVEQFGVERVGAAVLAKWISDEDAMEKWERLDAVVKHGTQHLGPVERRPFRYWVILWYFSMGYQAADVAEQLQVGVETVKQELKYARKKLGLPGKPLTLVIATAIREGHIP